MAPLRMLEPLQIRGMRLPNRVIMAPMETNIGVRNRKARAYYTERAKGGTGLITISGMSLDLYIDDDVWGKPGAAARFLEGCNLLAGDVHQAGAKLAAQLIHLNRIPSGTGLYDERGEPIAPSPREDVPRDVVTSIKVKKGLVKKIPCRELTVAEIADIVAKFGRAAAAVKSAGFDVVEFHGSHGYMPSQFFSPADNHRTDKYGGDIKGRARFGMECIQAMRAAVGNDFPIAARIGGYEYRQGGITPDQAAEYGALLEQAGADIISVSVGGTDRPRGYSNYVSPSPEAPLGCYADFAHAVKQKVKIAVAAVGRINTPEIAEEILGKGKADLLVVGRQLIADPHWVNKTASGHPEDIVPCQSCNTCMESIGREVGFHCTVNAAAGQEADYVETPAPKSKKVWVVGSGPAGLEAARVAAKRGHQVTLFEKGAKLGGQLLAAEVPPYKDVITRLNEYYAVQIKKAGVLVKTGQEVTVDLVAEGKPDAVVVATGALPITLNIPGAKGKNVALATEVLLGKKQTGSWVIVVGGGMVGCETAEFLMKKGKKVTLVEMLDEIGADMPVIPKALVQDRIATEGIDIETGARVEEITPTGIKATRGGKSVAFDGDSVVLAVGMKSVSGLAQQLKRVADDVRAIGDCVKPRKIVDAVAEGNLAGRGI